MPVALGFIETNSLIGAVEAANIMAKTSNILLLGKEVILSGSVTIKIAGEKEFVEAAINAGIEAVKKLGKNISSHIIVEPNEQMISVLPELSSLYFSLERNSKKKVKRSETGKKKNEIDKPKAETGIPKTEVGKNKLKKPEVGKQEVEKPKITKVEPEIEETPVKEKSPGQSEDVLVIHRPEKKLIGKKTGKKTDKKIITEIKEKKKINYRNDTIERLRREALGLDKPEKKKPVKKVIKKKKETKRKIKSRTNNSYLESLNVHQLRKLARSTKNFPIQGREISKAGRGTLLDYFKHLK